jgi:hypothetical protein
MSIVARKFNASPARLSSETWTAIATLVCDSDETAFSEFTAVMGIGSSILNDQLLEANPLVVVSKGPRLRIYCLYGEDAISGEDAKEESLSWKPTEEEWHVFVPCAADELKEVKKALKSKSTKFSAYDVDVGLPDDAKEQIATSDSAKASIDFAAFKKL